MKLCLATSLTILTLCSACNNAPSAPTSTSVVSAARVAAQPAPQPAPAAVAVAPSSVVAASAGVAASAAVATPALRRDGESSLKVKRLVVATGVKDREPLSGNDALPADGSPIYAFAELANPVGESENVRITFERKGGSERVGEVTLPVPGSTSRYRTWAFTRFIRAAGVWEAVLWSEQGTELGRTSFEVKAS